MDINDRLEEIRKQSKEDFQFMMIAFDNITKDVGTIQAKMSRQEERFELMLDTVQREPKDRVDPAVVADDEARLQALERQSNPAA